MSENYARVEREVIALRQKLALGELGETEFKQRLRSLMVPDERGEWWMVGIKTGEWHRYDGTEWVKANPYTPVRVEPTPAIPDRPVTPDKPTPRRFLGIVVFILGASVTCVLGIGLGNFVYENLGIEGLSGLYTAGCSWLLGLALSFLIARRIWQKR